MKTTEIILTSISLAITIIYHILLAIIIKKTPNKSVIGVTRRARRVWVRKLILEKNQGVLVVQTLRNSYFY